MEQRLSLVTLGVRDLARARAFYRAFGWREIDPDGEGIGFFQLPGLALSLYPLDALAEDAQLSVGPPSFGGITLAINMPSPADVDAVLEEAQGAGATLLKPAQAVFWGGYSGYFADLDGHPWEVAHNPFCTIHPDGRTSFRAAETS